MTRLRGGTNELRIETGRYAITNRDRPLELSERRCLICLNGEIEDETHFVLDCCVYEDLRQEMLDVVSSTLSRQLQKIEIGKARKEEEGRKTIMAALMGELFTSEPELKVAALQGNETQKQHRSGSVGPKDVRMTDNFELQSEREEKS